MVKPLLILFFLTLSVHTLAQQVLNTEITINPGAYAPRDVVEIIQNKGITVSYASRSLIKKEVVLQNKNYLLKDVLSQIFDLLEFTFIEREGKILIVPVGKSEITLSGYVEDMDSKERLIGVNVFLPELKLGTVTNKYGFYSITVNPGQEDILLAATFIGYTDTLLKLSPHRDHRIDIRLKIKSEALEEVTITEKNREMTIPQMSQVHLSTREIKAIPAFFGETDILKSIQLLPGVQNGSEGNINYIVRGGSPDQNLILLDGVPVYNASHLFGFFSVFNIDAIKNVTFTKGGFPSRFGGRLSSVLEIDMKEGNMEKFHGSGAIGLLTSKLTLEGPIVKNKASFMLSGRRTYFDLLMKPLIQQNNDFGYFYDDINAKVNYKFSRKDRIYLSFYTGRDKFYSNDERNATNSEAYLTYGNRTATVRWNHLYSDKLFSNLTTSFSRYNLSVGTTEESEYRWNAIEYYSQIKDYGLKYEFDYSYSSKHYFRAGASYTYHIFKPGAFRFNEEEYKYKLDSLLKISPFTYSHDAYLFMEDDWKINTRWRLNAGIHYSTYLVERSFYHSLQPRLTARYLLKPDWALKGSFSAMQQYVHLLTNSGSGLPTDLWVSSTAKIPPQRSYQWALGSTKELWNGNFEFTTEAYYKRMSKLITFEEGTPFVNSANWQDQVVINGTGNAYGIEFLFRKNKGKTTGWIAYTLSKTTRQFDEINDGEAYPYKYDRRHDLKLVLHQAFSESFSMGVSFILNSGIKATVPVAFFTDIYGNPEILYSKRNEFEYPVYHRLDLSFNWTKKKKWGERTWTLAFYNAYNRQNPYFIYFTRDLSGNKAHRVSLLPILPSFSYSFKF